MDARKILLVDDDKSIRVTLSQALEASGFQVVAAVDGDHALEKFRGDMFDLVLLDMRMPGLDGMEVLRHVKAQRPSQPVIMVTGFGSVETAVEALKLGAVDYIQKPFSPDELRGIVNRVLSRDEIPDASATTFEDTIEWAKRCIVERNLDEAEKHLRDAVRMDPTKPETFNLLGAISEIGGNVLEAQKLYRAALGLDPSYWPAIDNLARSVRLRSQMTPPVIDEKKDR
jgi:DNA-binding response OmpR family regulator